MNDCVRIFIEILDWWLRGQDDTDQKTIWESIIVALVAIEELRLAEKLRKRYLDIIL